jgi:hypothetical protein
LKEKPRDYLGDGVYVIFDGFGLELRANHHEFPTDKIYLEPEVFEALNRFWIRCHPPQASPKPEHEGGT